MVRSSGINSAITLDEVAERRGALASLERRVAADYGNVTVVDPVDYLCTDVCAQRSRDGWLYYDDDHLSVVGAKRIPFERFFRESLASN